MGSVVRGALDDGTAVAVKLVTRPFDEQTARRFARERDALARLRHPNVVGIVAGSEGPPPCLVLELVDGENLARLLEAGPLDPRRAAAIVADVALGLAHAHARGLVHRDVKPANVLVRAADERAVLTDFGIAKHLDASILTEPGTPVGTYLFMAPEQFRDGACPASDVWALGALLYEALTGTHPFGAAETLVELVAAVESARVTRPRAHDPTIPAALEAACLACLVPDPASRPTASDLARRLQLAASAPVQPARRRGPLVLGAGAALLGLGVLLGRAVPREGSPPHPASGGATPSPREASERVTRAIALGRAPDLADVLLVLDARPDPGLVLGLTRLLPLYPEEAAGLLAARGEAGRTLAAASLLAAGRLDGSEPNARSLLREEGREPRGALRALLDATRTLREQLESLDWGRLDEERRRTDSRREISTALAKTFQSLRLATADLGARVRDPAPCVEGALRDVARVLHPWFVGYVGRRELGAAVDHVLAPFEGEGRLGAMGAYFRAPSLGLAAVAAPGHLSRDIASLERLGRDFAGTEPGFATNVSTRALELRIFQILADRRAWDPSLLDVRSPAPDVGRMLALADDETAAEPERACAIAAVDAGLQADLLLLEARARLLARKPEGAAAARRRVETARQGLDFARRDVPFPAKRSSVEFWASQVAVATFDAEGPAALDPEVGRATALLWPSFQVVVALGKGDEAEARRLLAALPEAPPGGGVGVRAESEHLVRVLVPRPEQAPEEYVRGLAALEEELRASGPRELSNWHTHSTWLEAWIRARTR